MFKILREYDDCYRTDPFIAGCERIWKRLDVASMRAEHLSRIHDRRVVVVSCCDRYSVVAAYLNGARVEFTATVPT